MLNLESLPGEWSNYDLMVSASMLEYVPREELVSALSQLRSRLAGHGVFLLFVTPKNWITKLLIEKLWKANCYTGRNLESPGRCRFSSRGFQKISLFPLLAESVEPYR
ncbi:hypothetical protein SAMN05216386_2577 [Nitrosospira briensis]|uniref:Methyltransferase domain-containing protein n=1 Tax=Nitrosospira briensis TaxID=35799 RepID=A0A1I5EAF3_9PROT|nr:hypothetical protein SAMN05216386_2577 [Nitrosospira briensis]